MATLSADFALPLRSFDLRLALDVERTVALVVSFKTTAIAQALILLFGTPLAYLVASRRFRGRALVVTLVELPLVLPPAVAGLGLLAAFGRMGLLGSTFGALGISVSFTQTAVVLVEPAPRVRDAATRSGSTASKATIAVRM